LLNIPGISAALRCRPWPPERSLERAAMGCGDAITACKEAMQG